jgi:uncharacterized protein (DUF433 family)
MSPASLPMPAFGKEEQQNAYAQWGANCGPGALAGTCGITPSDVLRVMPDFTAYGHTREWMLEAALNRLGVEWVYGYPSNMTYGIARVLWGGPWSASLNRFDRLAHSHWIGLTRSQMDGTWVFDINAIAVGGWISMSEWESGLVPSLMATEEPDWDGTWSFGEGYAFSPIGLCDRKASCSPVTDHMCLMDIREDEHPYLHSHPEICGGRVVIRHSRLSSTAVAGRIADGETVADLLTDYPDLSEEMIGAALRHGSRMIAAEDGERGAVR